MQSHPAPPPPSHQLEWETPRVSRAPRRSGLSRFLPISNRPRHHNAAFAKETDISPVQTHRTTGPTPYGAAHTRWHKTYCGLRRRTLIIILLALLIIILALGLGLGLGLRRRAENEALPLPDGTSTLHTGELTYYAPGLGACGLTSAETDDIVAVSHLLYDAAAEKANTGANPNANPLCGKKIAIETGEGSVEVTVVDRCTGCKPKDLDVPLAVFKRLGLEERGRVEMKWRWV